MSHDIMPGLVGGATAVASPGQTGSAATGPPGDAGLSALFASLLAGSSGQGAKTGVLPEAQAGSLPGWRGLSEKQATKAAPRSLPIFPPPALPIKLNPGTIPTQPTTPPIAAGTAETQNAMDTSPVSGPRTKAETKPGGELPLPETRTNPSVALPAPPVLLIAASPVPATVTPTVPAASPTAAGVSRPVASGLLADTPSAASVASSAVLPPLPRLEAQALPSAFAVPKSVLVASVPGEAAVTPSALPQTFTLPVAAKPTVDGAAPVDASGQPVPAALIRPAATGTDGPPEKAAPPVFTRFTPAASSQEPYTLTSSALTVPAEAIAAQPSSTIPAVEVKAAAEVVTEPTRPATSGSVSLQPLPLPVSSEVSLTPGKAPAASLPALKSLGVEGKAPQGVTVPSSPATSPAPAQTAPAGVPLTLAPAGVSAPIVISLSVDPPTLMLSASARPTIQGTKTEADTKAATNGETTEGTAALPTLPVGTAKISLKSGPASADNNTRTQAVTTAKAGTAPPSSESTAKPSERSASETGKDADPSQADAPVPAQPAAPATATSAPTVFPTPLTRADRAEVIRQVADAVGTMPAPARPGTPSQMTLQLHPKDWGQLQISVRITPAVHPDAASPQTVTAHVVAASAGIKAALENGSSDLRHALRQAGLHLDKLTVTVQAPEAGAKSGTASGGGHHLMNGGGAQPQSDGRPNGGDSPQPSTASFASFTGSPQGGRQEGQAPAPQATPYGAGEPGEEPVADHPAPRRPAAGQVDMRA